MVFFILLYFAVCVLVRLYECVPVVSFVGQFSLALTHIQLFESSCVLLTSFTGLNI